MQICPRCKAQVEEVKPIPVSALPDDGGLAGGGEAAQACSRCVHEILEG